jgi:NADH dehydrogenase [ubiquinone] 1 alpha subcomplex assembly factor 6
MTDVSGRLFCINSVRTNDPDRYLLAMLAPPPVRDALFALYAFNVEIARTRELVSEAPLGEIRLQWWRDGIEALYAGNELRHGIGEALADTISKYELSRAYFDRLIDARSDDLDDKPPQTIDALLSYAENTAAPLVALGLEVLGNRTVAAQGAARDAGIAWSLIGLVRALPFHLRAHREYLPVELTQRHGVKASDLHDIKASDSLNEAIKELADLIIFHISSARKDRPAVGSSAVPAFLQVRFAELHVKRLSKLGFDPFISALTTPIPMVAWRLILSRITGRY